MNSFFRKKDVNSILDNNKNNSSERSLGAFDVTLMSIGATIGTGVMVLTGVVAARDAGPAVVLSFVGSAIACILVALCYAEFASSIPTSGSAYAYIYASLGEFIAHLVGWSLFIGYTVCTATVAGGWSAYFNSLLKECGIQLPSMFVNIPSQGGLFNAPAILVVLFITLLLSRGTKESKKINNLMVFVKLVVIVLFVAVGVFYIKPQNWRPFMPFGTKGVFAGAASVFLAYVYGSSRILFSMSRDGLLPKAYSNVNKKTNVPVLSTWIVGCLAALLAGVVDLKQLADLANMVLLATFSLVALSVIVLRKTHPKLERGFKVPLVPVIPLMAVACCLFLMFSLSKTTWLYFGIWTVLGVVVYFTYSHKHSSLNSKNIAEPILEKKSA